MISTKSNINTFETVIYEEAVETISQPADSKRVSWNSHRNPIIPRILLLFHVGQSRIDPGVLWKL